jgi:chondroitin polymerizing factor
MGSTASPDDKHCELSGGIIFSNSVIRKIKGNIDTCLKNSLGSRHSESIYNCVKLSTDIQECQTSWQGINISSFKLNSYKVYRDLYFLKEDENFNKATSVYPVHTPDDFYMLHAYFSRLHLEDIQKKMKSLELESQNVSNGSISNDVLEVRWPLGVPNSAKPQSRHDILVWTHLNLTHSFMSDQETNVKLLSNIEREDIQKIIARILTDVSKKHPTWKFHELKSAYKKFDAVRGMDYRIQILFRNEEKQEFLKSYEVVKPISLIEIVPSPYVTESTRITILLPTFEHDIENAIDFVQRYEKNCMENQDNTFLMLVMLYRIDSSNKGETDVFLRLKTLALSLSEKYKGFNSRVAWVSIRLPEEFSDDYNENDLMINSVYGKNEVLSLAVTDLALRKVGLESLVMIVSNTVTFKMEFLNRVSFYRFFFLRK